MTEENVQKIRDLIDNTAFEKWKLSSLSPQEKSGKDWSFAFELADGEVVNFVIGNVLAQEEASDFVKYFLNIDGNEAQIERMEKKFEREK